MGAGWPEPSVCARAIDDKYSRREEYRGFTQDFKEKDGYKPDVKIEYVDETGRKLTPKEVRALDRVTLTLENGLNLCACLWWHRSPPRPGRRGDRGLGSVAHLPLGGVLCLRPPSGGSVRPWAALCSHRHPASPGSLA